MSLITPQSEKFLFQYLNNASPTGFEAPGQKLWLEYLKPYIDDWSLDNYGTAYGTGHISFLGATNNIQIKAEAQTSKGTRLSIPIGGLTGYEVNKKEYIEFVDLKNKQTQAQIAKSNTKPKVAFKGIQLDFDLEFTQDAYVELIFDMQAGDIIRGRGNGNIELERN